MARPSTRLHVCESGAGSGPAVVAAVQRVVDGANAAWSCRARIPALCLAIAAVGLAQSAHAAGVCRPTRDGKDRIEKIGACPSGYFARGACCESFQANSQPPVPVPGAKTCPAGTVLKLGICVAGK